MTYFDNEPPPELCLGCGDDFEFGDPIGTSERHICTHRQQDGASDD